MADSENSRTLPSITYTNPLRATEVFLVGMAAGQGAGDERCQSETLTRWMAWWDAHCECTRLCELQQRLESELFQKARRQKAKDRTPSTAFRSITLEHSNRGHGGRRPIEVLLETETKSSGLSQLGAADGASRLSQLKTAEHIASIREQELAQELWATPAGGLISAIAKLHCVIRQGEPSPDDKDFPWPQIRSALLDLLISRVPNNSPPSG